MRFIKGDSLKDAIERFHKRLSTDFTDSTDKTVRESVKSVDVFSSLEFRKLLGRHRVLVASAAVCLVVALGALIVGNALLSQALW
jgi:hypothetical protein